MVVTRNMDARLEALGKAMEEQANCLAAFEAKLDERAAIQKSQFDLFLQQIAALGSLLGHKVMTHTPATKETTTTVYLPPPVVATTTAIATARLVLSSPPSSIPALITTKHLAPYSHDVPPTPPSHLPFLLQQSSPLLSTQQPIVLLPFYSASQPPAPAPVTVPDAVCVYLAAPLLHTIILVKALVLGSCIGLIYWCMPIFTGCNLLGGRLKSSQGRFGPFSNLSPALTTRLFRQRCI